MLKIRLNAMAGLVALGLTNCAASLPPEPAPADIVPTQQSRFDAASLEGFLASAIENNRAIGVSALIYVDGQEAYFGTAGLADREAGTPMTRETLSNIYSMTKPVTGVTLMTLYDEGLFDLDDLLSDYLPEFTDMQVMVDTDEDGEMILEPVARPIKIIDVMRHSAGFGYGWEGGALGAAHVDLDLLNPVSNLETFSQDLASLPLFYQPGTRWQYSVSADLQARLAEVIGGKPYDELVQKRVFTPLGMTETGYHAPNDQKARVSAIYIKEEEGAFVREPDEQVYGFWTQKPSLIPGGHGLVSTLDDYMKFALMLQNEGTYNGVQILKPETVALMAMDHLPDDVTDTSWLTTKGQVGFGLNFAVRVAPPADEAENKGSMGEFFWDGRASTLFWVDPKEDLTAVFFTQVVPFDTALHHDFRDAVYAGLEQTDETR